MRWERCDVELWARRRELMAELVENVMAGEKLYTPRTMRRCQLGIILFIGVGGVDGWEVLPALVC
jgi:tRNA A37 threonylcarbamoyladenosine dehydratase